MPQLPTYLNCQIPNPYKVVESFRTNSLCSNVIGFAGLSCFSGHKS